MMISHVHLRINTKILLFDALNKKRIDQTRHLVVTLLSFLKNNKSKSKNKSENKNKIE
jgi:hypothetical protein